MVRFVNFYLTTMMLLWVNGDTRTKKKKNWCTYTWCACKHQADTDKCHIDKFFDNKGEPVSQNQGSRYGFRFE